MNHIRVAVVGQPNTGKTSIINSTSGSKLKVGNFHGVTTEMVEISYKYRDSIITFIDLPGLYSTSALSDEEEVTSNFIQNHPHEFDIILNVIEIGHIEKNLQLTIELLSATNKPIVVALNMSDEAKEGGFVLDTKTLAKTFQIPFVLTSARRKTGITEMMDHIMVAIHSAPNNNYKFPPTPVERSAFIHKIVHSATVEYRPTNYIDWTDKLDRILLNRWMGVPLLLSIMFGVFFATFTAGEYPSDIIENTGSALSSFIQETLPSHILTMGICDGLIPGIFIMLSFLPRIMIMLLCTSILEKSGYMARVAFLIDGIMHKFGIHGKAAISIATGFSCSIPAYMSTRILSNRKARIATMFAIGMVPCSAKMTLFVLLTGALFGPKYAPYFMFLIYILGIVFGMIAGLIASKSMRLSNKDDLFALEMPRYRIPEWKMIKSDLIVRVNSYIKSAGTLIAVMSFLIWMFGHIPYKVKEFSNYKRIMHELQQDGIVDQKKHEHQEYILSNSIIGGLGYIVSPIFAPLGFDWKMNISLLTAIAAKEVAISTLGILYHVNIDDEHDTIRSTIKDNIKIQSGVAYIIFALIYIPCISAMAIFKKEAGNVKYLYYLILLTTIMAWSAAFIFYHITNYIIILIH